MPDNLSVVREHIEATNRRDFAGAMASYAEDVELFVPDGLFLETGTYRGRDAVGRWFGEWFRTFSPGYRMTIFDAVEAPDQVVVSLRHRGQGRASGIEVESSWANAYWLRDGQIVRIALYPARAEALSAAGLDDAPDSPR
jgi:ketosteroid isomerase-like protein